MSKRQAMVQELKALGLSERLACRLAGIARSSFRYQPQPAPDDEPLRAEVLKLAQRHRRYGYRRITALLRRQEHPVNAKRVWRIWKSAGLSLPRKRPRRCKGLGVELPQQYDTERSCSKAGASTKLARGPVLRGRSLMKLSQN